jgi:hypothetical protein
MSGGTAATRPVDRAGSERSDDWRVAVAIHAGVLAVLLLVSWVIRQHVVVNPRSHDGLRFAGDWFFGGWYRWDGGWYVRIAQDGYSYVPGRQSSVAYFPGYPLTVRAVGGAMGNLPLGGIGVTIVAGAAAVHLFWRWATVRLDRRAALLALCALALYPYAWYLYGAVYGDALFLLAVIGSFTLLEADRPVLAGVAGIVATGTRSVGLALLCGLIVGVVERRGAMTASTGRFRLRTGRLRRGDAGVLLPVLGIGAWMLWLWHRFGDPFLFSSVQSAWGQPSAPSTWFKSAFFRTLGTGEDPVYAVGLVVQGALALGVLALVPAIARRFGVRYAVYTAVLVALPLIGSKDFQGLGRYLIAAFPAFAVVGVWLGEDESRPRVVLTVAGMLLVVATAAFSRGYYLA